MKRRPSKATLQQQKTNTAQQSRLPAFRRDEIIEMVPLVLKLKKILVPIDFSKAAEKALRYAVAFARQLEARITVLHVHQIPNDPAEMAYPTMALLTEEPFNKTLARRLETDARRLIPAETFEATVVRVGAPFDEICKAAAELDADLIIISTHGYTGLKHVLMGSTAERVVRHAQCPVLVVREKEHEFA